MAGTAYQRARCEATEAGVAERSGGCPLQWRWVEPMEAAGHGYADGRRHAGGSMRCGGDDGAGGDRPRRRGNYPPVRYPHRWRRVWPARRVTTNAIAQTVNVNGRACVSVPRSGTASETAIYGG